MPKDLSLIGIAPAAGAAALCAALREVPGPAVSVHVAGDVALFTAAPEGGRRRALLRRDRTALLAGLHRQQRRLEIACLAGPFLVFDPAAASCPVAEIPRLLGASQAELAIALERDGRRHQWDVVLRWPPESVVAQHRARLADSDGRAALAAAIAALLRNEVAARNVALRAALRPVAIDIAEQASVVGEAETAVTVLIAAGSEAAIEAALSALSPAASADASADLRGPLPPISFAPLRVTELGLNTLTAAWRALDLPERLDRTELTRRWREMALRLHPDQGGEQADPARLDAAGRAYRLLRGLAADGPLELAALRSRVGRQLTVPVAESA